MSKWETVRLGDVCVCLRNGLSVKQSENAVGDPITRIETISDSDVDLNKVGFANIRATDYPDYCIKEGDLLVSNINSWKHLGKTALVRSIEGPLIHGMNLLLVRTDPKKVSPAYLKYYFGGLEFRKYIDRIANQSVNQSSFSVNNLRDLRIPLPPLATQQKIAAILDKADALRRKDKALLAKYDELAQAIFVDMFGDPVKNEKGWEVRRLGEVCEKIKDGPHASLKYVESGVPFISVANVIKGEIDFVNCRFITIEDYKLHAKKCKPEKGDILYTKGGTTGYAIRIDTEIEFLNWVHIAVLKLKRGLIDSCFLQYMLNSEYCYNQSQRLTRGIANRDLVLSEMAKISILLPPMDYQRLFATRIELVERLMSEAIKTNHSETLFQSLLQRAFRGELLE